MTRDEIIEHLTDKLKNDSLVYAFWLEGADAQDRTDEYSDIDIWLDVEDGHESETLNKIEIILSELGKVDFSYEVKHPHPKIKQGFFHIEGTSEFLIIDVCVQSHSRVFWYTEGFQDEKAKVIFDKDNVIKYKPMNQQEFEKETSARIAELKKTFPFFQTLVKKSANRGNFLEALGSYHEKILNPLVEILRIKYQPTKKDFYLKDISRDIPKKLLTELEDLYKIDSLDDIKTKGQKAEELFFDSIKEVER